MEAYQTLFFVSVFGAGILSFFSPCIFPLLPVYLGNLIEDTGESFIRVGKQKLFLLPVLKTLAFIAGLSSVFFILGFGAGALGAVVNSRYTTYVMGALVVLLGLHQMEVINMRRLQVQKSTDFNKKKRGGMLGAYLLGLTFSFGWTPCIGPVLSAVLAVAASSQHGGAYGAFLMIVYALGMAIPFLVLALSSSIIMKHFVKVKKHLVLLKKIGGALIVLMGLVLMFGQLNAFTALIQ